MNKGLEITLPLLLTFLLAAPLYAHADGGIVVQPIINFDVGSLLGGIAQNASAITGALGSVPGAIFDLFRNYLENAIREMNLQMLDFLRKLVSANPDPESMKPWADSVSIIISAFYLLIFMAAGFAFILGGMSAGKRARAKEWLSNAVIMVVAVDISFPMYKLILEMSTAITNFLWDSVPENLFLPAISGLNIALLFFLGCSIVFALMTIFMRYLFLLVAAGLFPLGLFLYFTPPLNRWGRAVLNLIGAALAMQFVDVLIFAAAGSMLLQFSGPAGALVPALAFIVVGLANIALMFYALLKSALIPFGSEAPNAHGQLSQALHSLSENIGTLASTMPAAQK